MNYSQRDACGKIFACGGPSGNFKLAWISRRGRRVHAKVRSYYHAGFQMVFVLLHADLR